MTTPSHYKSLLFYGPGDVRVESLPTPQPATGEVLVRIAAAATCGTDHKTFRRGHPVLIKSIPAPLGHEMAGTVVKTGVGVTSFKPGDRVAIGNSGPCLECFFCKKGEANLCEQLEFLNGAFAEYIIVPATITRSNLHRIPDHLNFAKAALSEPLACVLHAHDHMRITRGETVAIIGTGPMAYLFAQVLRQKACRSLVIGRNTERLAQLRGSGADFVIDVTREDPLKRVRRITDGYGADVVIEAVGQPQTWEQAVSLARKGGRVCLYGGCARGTVMYLDTYRAHYEQITVSGVFHYTPAHFTRAIAMLATDEIDAGPLLTAQHSLSALPSLLADTDAKRPMKSVIRMAVE